MSDLVRKHYQCHPYPQYPLIASVRRCDTYALNLKALWIRFNSCLPPPDAHRVLVAGCGTFAPYPFSVANPDAMITALDLSERSLMRARLHCLLHGKRNVVYRCLDLLDIASTEDKFGLIDAFGVLHHLTKPLQGLKKLESLLIPGGIIRIMVYSRYARREEEAIRYALRLLGVREADRARQLLRSARPGSRLAGYVAAADEVNTLSGIADALLHPRVQTYKIGELLGMIRQTELEPLLFAHQGALEDSGEEVQRLQILERDRLSPGNFILYLGKKVSHPAGDDAKRMIVLNPCLESAVSQFTFGTMHVPSRFGNCNPSLDRLERRFLRQFINPVNCSELKPDVREAVDMYKRALFLLEYAT
ncbi:MAG: methyltransferase [Desulfuromonadales bacterium]